LPKIALKQEHKKFNFFSVAATENIVIFSAKKQTLQKHKAENPK
jgi:hypothetical protein